MMMVCMGKGSRWAVMESQRPRGCPSPSTLPFLLLGAPSRRRRWTPQHPRRLRHLDMPTCIRQVIRSHAIGHPSVMPLSLPLTLSPSIPFRITIRQHQAQRHQAKRSRPRLALKYTAARLISLDICQANQLFIFPCPSLPSADSSTRHHGIGHNRRCDVRPIPDEVEGGKGLSFPHLRQEQEQRQSSPRLSPLSLLFYIQQMQTELLDSALAMAGQSLHCHHPVDAFPPNFAMDMLALDRQVASLRWQQHNPTTVTSHAALDHNNHFSLPAGMFLGTGEPAQESTEVLMRDQQTPITTTTTTTATTTDVDGPRMGCGWQEMTQHQMTSHHVQPTSFPTGPFTTVTESKPFSTLSRTTSCPPAMGSVLSSAARMGLRSCKIPSSPLSGDGSRKRKTVRNEVLAALATPKVEGSKTIKGEILEADELGPDVADKGGESSGYGGKENPKGAAPSIPKPDYIHVRARRGQATDSHSLAERVRREKISERMKLLQDLVPGCNKITGKAGMLDEIINYVQSLQRQVEFLSMKLAAVSPKSEGTGDSYMGKEVFPLCHSNFPGVGISPEVTPSSYAHLNMMQSATGASIRQQQGGCGAGGGRIDVPVNSNPSGMTTLRRTTSAPVAVTDDFIDSCFRDCSLPSNSAWDFDLQGLYTMDLHHQPGQQQQPAFSPQTSFVTGGHSEMHNLKMEMM